MEHEKEVGTFYGKKRSKISWEGWGNILSCANISWDLMERYWDMECTRNIRSKWGGKFWG